MKSKEELNALKEEINTLNRKLVELDEEELKQTLGGGGGIPIFGKNSGLCGRPIFLSGKCPSPGHPINQIYTDEPSPFCDDCQYK